MVLSSPAETFPIKFKCSREQYQQLQDIKAKIQSREPSHCGWDRVMYETIRHGAQQVLRKLESVTAAPSNGTAHKRKRGR